MKVFISGASGLVGGNCMKYFREKGWQVTGSHFSFATEDTVYFDSLHPENPESFDIVQYAPDVIEAGNPRFSMPLPSLLRQHSILVLGQRHHRLPMMARLLHLYCQFEPEIEKLDRNSKSQEHLQALSNSMIVEVRMAYSTCSYQTVWN